MFDPLWLLSGYAMRQTPPTVNAQRMQFGGLDRVVLALYLSDATIVRIGDGRAWQAIKEQVRMASAIYPDQFLALEGGRVLGNNPIDATLRIAYLASIGIKYLTLVHNANNNLAGSATDSNPTGMTVLGFDVLEECEEKGILIDVSHLAERAFVELMPYVRKPVIASHSGCKAVLNSIRNLDDKQISHIAMTKGIICIPFARKFVGSIAGIANHVDHVCQVTGSVSHVGIGSDLDGAVTVTGVLGAEDWSKAVVDSLTRKGFSDEAISQVAGGNLLRVFGEDK